MALPIQWNLDGVHARLKATDLIKLGLYYDEMAAWAEALESAVEWQDD